MSEMYERFCSDRKGAVSRLDFWFSCQMDFSAIATQVKERFLASEVIEDCENVYEWVEFISNESRYFNLSYKYEEPVDLNTNPFHLFVEDSFFERDLVVHVGKTLAGIIDLPVYCGKVKYISGDTFEYETKETFEIGI